MLGCVNALPNDKPPALAVAPFVAVTVAPTAGVRVTPRCPPVHSVLLGPARVVAPGTNLCGSALTLPGAVPHCIVELAGRHAGVAYLDARAYSFADVQRLAFSWRGFVPGQDDLRELVGDAQRLPRRRLDPRVERGLEALELSQTDVPTAARVARLSESRFTHVVSDTLGVPPRTWRSWFRLCDALTYAACSGAGLSASAHHASFADAAHFTRTSRKFTGVSPGSVMPCGIIKLG